MGYTKIRFAYLGSVPQLLKDVQYVYPTIVLSEVHSLTDITGLTLVVDKIDKDTLPIIKEVIQNEGVVLWDVPYGEVDSFHISHIYSTFNTQGIDFSKFIAIVNEYDYFGIQNRPVENFEVNVLYFPKELIKTHRLVTENPFEYPNPLPEPEYDILVAGKFKDEFINHKLYMRGVYDKITFIDNPLVEDYYKAKVVLSTDTHNLTYNTWFVIATGLPFAFVGDVTLPRKLKLHYTEYMCKFGLDPNFAEIDQQISLINYLVDNFSEPEVYKAAHNNYLFFRNFDNIVNCVDRLFMRFILPKRNLI